MDFSVIEEDLKKRPPKKMICVRVEQDIHDELKRRELCPSVLIRALLKYYLQGRPLDQIRDK